VARRPEILWKSSERIGSEPCQAICTVPPFIPAPLSHLAEGLFSTPPPPFVNQNSSSCSTLLAIPSLRSSSLCFFSFFCYPQTSQPPSPLPYYFPLTKLEKTLKYLWRPERILISCCCSLYSSSKFSCKNHKTNGEEIDVQCSLRLHVAGLSILGGKTKPHESSVVAGKCRLPLRRRRSGEQTRVCN